MTPHGGKLIDRIATEERGAELRERLARDPGITLDERQLADLELIAIGGYSPLTGFMGADDYEGVVTRMQLANGRLWSIPVTLASEVAVKRGQTVALRDAAGALVGAIQVSEAFAYDKQREAEAVYRTADAAHPGVAAVYAQGDTLVAGEVWRIERQGYEDILERHRHDPAQLRAMFAERGWRTIVGFQTRNPVHRAHEFIQKCALEIVDGLLLHPLVGATKEGDVPADVRMRCYEALLAGYYPSNRSLLAILPAAMRYAGPREAIFHALIRKNYGCTHFIVGRDHAGVGDYYGTYDAHRIFDDVDRADLGIQPLCFEDTFWCTKCGGMASTKTCPHGEELHSSLSGTKVRELLAAGQPLPVEFTRPEVAEVLRAAYKK